MLGKLFWDLGFKLERLFLVLLWVCWYLGGVGWIDCLLDFDLLEGLCELNINCDGFCFWN